MTLRDSDDETTLGMSYEELKLELAKARRTVAAQASHIQMLAGLASPDRTRRQYPQADAANDQVRYLVERLHALESSTSWRVTKPLRDLKVGLRDFKRRVNTKLRHLPLAKPRTKTEPLISVVVPNYNHAEFLRRRLDSIYGQSYRNIEVLLLDDLSQDGSVDILTEYANRYAANTRLIVNDRNSGGPFRQWARGISLAKGDIVWIAESDDSCEENFLSTLVSAFDDEAVLLAYGDIQYIDREDRPVDGLDGYRRGTGYNQWQSRYVRPAEAEFSGPFGVRNIIPNVSGALFRKPTLTDSFVELLSTYKVCGDWIFYMYVASGGKVAYEPGAKSHYRQHSDNVSVSATSTRRFYEEHERVAVALRERYGVSDATMAAHFGSVVATYRHAFRNAASDFELSAAYHLPSVLTKEKTSLNILICSLAFSLGGGELLPIFLANSLRQQGHNVTFLVLSNEDTDDPKMRSTLDASIAVLRPSSTGTSLSYLADFGIDVINTHNIGAEYQFSGAGIASPDRPSYVVTHHGSYEVSHALPSHLQDFAGFVDHWVYLTDKNLHRLQHAGVRTNNRTKLPNGVPNAEQDPALSRSAMGISDDAFVCALVSRAIPEKGWQEAIDAVSSLNASGGRPVELLLIGGGPEFERLRNTELPAFVKLLGTQSKAARYYHLADVGILPTFFPGESFPLTIAECLVVGRPFVATDRGEIRNMLTTVDGATAGVVLVDTPQGGPVLSRQLEDALRHLRDDDTAYLGSAAAAKEQGNGLGADMVARRYVEVFKSTIAHRYLAARRDVQ